MKTTWPILLGPLLLAAPAAQAQFDYTTANGAITITGYTGSGGAVTIPSTINGLPVTSIGGEAFANVDSMTSVLIPGTVANIGDYGFAYCTSLRNVYFEGNAPIFGLVVFSLDPASFFCLPGATGWAFGSGVAATELTAVAITADPTNGVVPLTVGFTSEGVDSAGNTVSNWNWNFEDGSTSTAQNPSHDYTNGGTFSVALVETNAMGFPIAGSVALITVSRPTLAFTANPTNGAEPVTVSFTSPDVDSGGSAITSWGWNFGDGSTSTAQNPSHTYTTDGTFSVTLFATNNIGDTVTGSGPASILALEPLQAQFNYTTNNGAITITGYTGSGGAVTIPSSINGLPVTSIGGEAFANVDSMTSVSIPGSVAYLGDYAFAYCTSLRNVYFEGNVSSFGLVVFSQDSAASYYLAGATGWEGIYVDGVATKELTAITITANPSHGVVPLKVDFTSAGVDSASNAISNWNWTFGDGSTNATENPSHSYTNVGTFCVTLVETNTDFPIAGESIPIAGSVVSITVSPPTLAFTANPTNGLEPLAVSFTSPDVDSGGSAITSWNWTFGDGSTSTAQNPAHTYTSGGTFSPALIVTNNIGFVVAGSGPASITVSSLTVAFAANPPTGVIPLTVSFTSAGVDSAGNTITSWNWTFGDDSTSTAQNPSHSYTIPGTFSLALIATNNMGDTITGSGPASLSTVLPVPTNFTVLHAFTGSGGAYPYAGPILSGNTLYGTTEYSIAPISGTVFSLNIATANFIDLYHFPDLVLPNDLENVPGANPECRLILSGNTLYGTASAGGADGFGTVFTFNTETSKFIPPYYFRTATYDTNTGLHYNSDGVYPQAALVLVGNTLYGTATYGGADGHGTVFSLSAAGFLTPIYTFTGGNDGSFPLGDLIASGSTLYGTANRGGSNGYGDVFSVNTNGSNFEDLYSFTGGSDGANPPQGGLLLWSNTLYGTAAFGGSNGFGAVFSVNTNGSNFEALYSFTGGSDGAYPGASLIISGETLYGTAFGGGPAGHGTVFSLGLSAHGSDLTMLYGFTGYSNADNSNSDGANPQPGLVLSSNILYGAARYGGYNSCGTVFELPLPGAALAPILLTDIGATAPTPGANDIAQLSNSGNTIPAGLNYYWDDGFEHPTTGAPGQSFTTLRNPNGYTLTSVAIKTGGLGDNGGHNGALYTEVQPFALYVFALSNPLGLSPVTAGLTNATLIASFTATSHLNADGDWMQWTGLAVPLAPGTNYAFAFGILDPPGGNGEWESISVASGLPYAGGQVCLVPNAGGQVTYSSDPNTYDMTFDLGLAVASQVALSIAPAGEGSLSLSWSQGTLLQTTNLAGPWTTNTVPSPYTIAPTNSKMYFKVLVQ